MEQKFLIASDEELSELGLFRQKINLPYPCEITVEGKIGPHSRYDLALKRKPKIIRIRSLNLIEYEDKRCFSMMAKAATGIDPHGKMVDLSLETNGHAGTATDPLSWSDAFNRVRTGRTSCNTENDGNSGYGYRPEPQKRNWDFNPKKKNRRNPYL